MKIWIGITLVVLLITGTAFGQCSDADKKALEAFDHTWTKAIQGGDKGALEKILADDYRAVPGMGDKEQNISEWMANYERNRANPSDANPPVADRYMIACSKNLATITHRNIFTSNDGPGGRERTNWSRSIHFLEKRGGNWQVVSTLGHAMDDAMMIYYLDQDWTEANVKRDKAWFEKNFADDFSSVSSTDGKTFDKASDIEDTMNSKGTVEMAESTNLDIKVDRNMGVVTGIYHWKGTDENGKSVENRVRYTDTYIKRDGRWQVWATISVPIKEN